MSWVKNWLKNKGIESKGPPQPPQPPAMDLVYKFTAEAKGGPLLLIEIPGLVQMAGPLGKGPQRLVEAQNSYDSAYLRICFADGSIRRQYSAPGASFELLLSDNAPGFDITTRGKEGLQTVGWTFMLGAIELVNGNQFDNHFYPSNWLGFNTIWDIASVMENGERCMFTRNANSHDVMLKFTNQMRMLLAPIQAAQRPNRAKHVEMYKTMRGFGFDSFRKGELVRRRSEFDREALVSLFAGHEWLGQHYAETFKPPELLF